MEPKPRSAHPKPEGTSSRTNGNLAVYIEVEELLRRVGGVLVASVERVKVTHERLQQHRCGVGCIQRADVSSGSLPRREGVNAAASQLFPERAGSGPTVRCSMCMRTCFGSETSSSASRPHAATQHKEDSTLCHLCLSVYLIGFSFLPSITLTLSFSLSLSLITRAKHRYTVARETLRTVQLFCPVLWLTQVPRDTSFPPCRTALSRHVRRLAPYVFFFLFWFSRGLQLDFLLEVWGWRSIPPPIWVTRGCYSCLAERVIVHIALSIAGCEQFTDTLWPSSQSFAYREANSSVNGQDPSTLTLMASQSFAFREETEPVIIVIASACTWDGYFSVLEYPCVPV